MCCAYSAKNSEHTLSATLAPHADARGHVKMGHAGTLDPLASGLMLVGIGRGTKQLSVLTKLDKVYEAEVCLGERSACGDAEGPIVERVEAVCSEEDVRRAVETLRGTHTLAVPVYSAVKRGGESLYKKVRRGEDVVAPVREMTIYECVLLGVVQRGACTFATVRFHVASGVYIRSLAEELGRKLGYPARLESLKRTRVGVWRVEDTIRLQRKHES